MSGSHAAVARAIASADVVRGGRAPSYDALAAAAIRACVFEALRSIEARVPVVTINRERMMREDLVLSTLAALVEEQA